MEEIVCKGFKAGGVASGLKKNGNKDLGILYSEKPAVGAGVFTKNLIQASSVGYDRECLNNGECQAIIVNSGNANCCTGERGMQDTIAMAKSAASGLGIEESLVLVASTGVIGEPLPVEKIETAVPVLAGGLTSKGFTDFAESIMTTDTVTKIVSKQGEIDGKTYTVTGVAKGAGMIQPNMATMLCFVCTDIGVSQDVLKKALAAGVDRSFNRITIDGDTSTNDMVVVMANGLSGAEVSKSIHENIFQDVLDDVLISLAKMVVKDGEGATKLVEIKVKGAGSDKDAYIIADTVANSNLVKTAFFGEDANWGRIIGAVGRAGVPVSPNTIDIYFNDIIMVKNSMGCGDAAEAEATKVLKESEFAVTIDLNMGTGETTVFTCDFSLDYVRINADYRS